MLLKIILTIVALAVIMTGVFCLFRNHYVNEFRKNIQEGMPCVFFIEEDRVIGVVAVVGSEGIVINSVYGQYKRPVDEIYPV